MDYKPKNRDWVKNAAIIFLTVLLVLTFFSNTIMNRSLPEVATQMVTDGSITAKVRGTGTVVANGNHQVKAEQTREIRAVMIKSGQEISAGDVLFILGQGESEELEAAQENLRQLRLQYQRAAINVPTFNYDVEKRRIKKAEEALEEAKLAEAQAYQKLLDDISAGSSGVEDLKLKIEDAKATLAQLEADAEAERARVVAEVEAARLVLEQLLAQQEAGNAQPPENPDAPPAEGEALPEPPDLQTQIDNARAAYADAQAELAALSFPAVEAQKAYVAQLEAKLETMLGTGGPYYDAYQAAVKLRKAAEDELFELKNDLDQRVQSDNKSQQLSYLEMQELSTQINKAQQELAELSGGEENQITAKVSGTVQSIECTSGDTVAKDQILCTIEVPDMGYTLGFSVTNDQARRLRVGDTATVSNYYWGSEIVATLSTIKTDPKNPMSNKLLSFDLSGDVTAGAELSISVGQKSANYDLIIPNSSIRSDANGSFVLRVRAKNSPLGNRYFAERVSIEVLAADDKNSAVTGDLSYGDYLITTGNAPVANGDMVQLADN